MKLTDFDYDLPKELIAQTALPKRTDARLLVLDRNASTVTHRHFSDCIDYFKSGDVLVLNDTKVLPARLIGKRKTGGRVEILLLEEKGKNDWKVLAKPSRRVRKDEVIFFGQNGNRLCAKVLDATQPTNGIRRLKFIGTENIKKNLNDVGRIPLPPYINREDLPIDRELYQTVFAKKPGAIASPTAGLHFDVDLLGKIKDKGIDVVFVTLHVGYGTFQSVATDDVSKHQMYSEYYEVPKMTAEKINKAKSEGRRIVACGTTVVRALESSLAKTVSARVRAAKGTTNLFIHPPHSFRVVDAMITNFHLPRTTLLMLTAAFCGLELQQHAYQEAIANRYRFFSYGDAMLII